MGLEYFDTIASNLLPAILPAMLLVHHWRLFSFFPILCFCWQLFGGGGGREEGEKESAGNGEEEEKESAGNGEGG